MGRGNFVPAYAEETSFFYVDFNPHGDEQQHEEWEMAYEDFISNLESMLPDSFSKVNKWERSRGYGNDEHIVFENEFMTVAFADNEWSMVVIFRYKHRKVDGEEIDALDGRGMRVAKSVVKKLLKSGYELRARNGPWMSSKVREAWQVFA